MGWVGLLLGYVMDCVVIKLERKWWKTYSSSKNVRSKNNNEGGKCESRRWYRRRRSNLMSVLFMSGGNIIRRITVLWMWFSVSSEKKRTWRKRFDDSFIVHEDLFVCVEVKLKELVCVAYLWLWISVVVLTKIGLLLGYEREEIHWGCCCCYY